MIAAIWLALLAASARVELVDETFEIPPAEWRYVDLNLKQEPATVWCHFESLTGGQAVRVALLRREDLERMRQDRAHGMLAATRPAQSGTLRHTVATPGEFAVLVDNREGAAARVHLRVWLDFSRTSEPHVRYASPQRRAVVVTLSLGVFGAIVLYSVRKLRRAGR